MIIVIDAYNLLKNQVNGSDVSDKERAQFLKMLGKYAQRKKHSLVVVFDGGPYEWPHRETIASMRVIYSGCHETADDFIMSYLDEHHAKEMLLVSSDHELALYASDLDIPSIGSYEFFDIVKSGVNESVIKEHDVSVVVADHVQDIDELMQQASRHVPVKQEDVLPSVDKRPNNKASKKEKRLYRILKKL